MPMNHGLSDLLEYIRQSSACSYLSDLHDDFRCEQILVAIKDTIADDFPIGEWLTAAEYITGEKPGLCSVSELRTFILSHLEKKSSAVSL